MGWIYFPESAGSVSDSGTSSEQSAMSKSTRTARKSCKPELKTNCLMTPLSGMILQHSTGDPGMDVWILSMAGFPARTSRLPEKVQVFGESVQDCFSKSSGSFAKYNPDTSSWRTFQLCLDGEWELYSESFPRAGMMRCGTVCRRVPWVPLTGGTGSGYLPSPSVCGNYNRKGVSKTSGDGLATAVRMLLTPQALVINLKDGYKRDHSIASLQEYLSGKNRGLRLQPAFVAWLMGYPIGWTDLKPLETQLFHKWLEQFLE